MPKRGRSVLDRLRSIGEAHAAWNEAAFTEAVLKARARRLAALRGHEEVLVDSIDALGVRVAGERYAVAVADLSEVMALGRWTPVPGQPSYLLGVTNLRGEIRPVLDLHSLLGLAPPAPEARCWVVFLNAGGAEVGLRVDALDRVVQLDPSGLTRPQETGNGLPQRFISGIAADALILLDTAQLLALDALVDRRVGGLDES